MHLVLSLLACSPSDSAIHYYGDVQPILNEHCVGCHHDEGVGPHALTTYDEVQEVASAVSLAVQSRIMPPWQSTGDCAEYDDHNLLSDEHIATLVDWVETGAPQGDVGLDQPVPPLTEPLPDATHTIELPAYRPAQSADDYRCFVMDWPDTSIVSFLTGLVVDPDHEQLVHHVIPFVVGPSEAAAYTELDGEDGQPGYACYGSPGGTAWTSQGSGGYRWVGGWAPGGSGGTYPEGTGIPVEGGSKLIVQVHYHTESLSEDAPEDQSMLRLRISDSVEDWAAIYPITDTAWVYDGQMAIPAETLDVTHRVELPMSSEFLIHSGAVHMHTLGREARFALQREEGGEECLVHVKNWDFDWQRYYRLSTPIRVEPGDALSLECRWDNRTSSEVNWGDGTDDEMCLGLMYVTGS